MTTYQVIGPSPVSFISEDITGNVGKQFQIPISALSVTNGQPDPTNWLKAVKIKTDPDKTLVANLIADLAARNVLSVVVVSP